MSVILVIHSDILVPYIYTVHSPKKKCKVYLVVPAEFYESVTISNIVNIFAKEALKAVDPLWGHEVH